MPFHRFKDADYAILPGDTYATGAGTMGGVAYDRVNVTDEGVGSGGDGSALADTQKSGGVNIDTYWVAFGENATSLFTNRGFKALSENTDAIDNILRGSIPAVTTQAAAAAGGVASYTFSGIDVLVGTPSGPGTPASYMEVVDLNGAHIYNGGVRVVVSDIQINGGGPSVVGTEADGFYTDPTVIFSPAIPAGASFTIIFGARRSYARMLEAANVHEMNTNHLIARSGVGRVSPLLYSGLNEAYRRSSKPPGGTSGTAMAIVQNAAGDGALITRDGKAITTKGVNLDQIPIAQTVAVGPDPFLAYTRSEFAADGANSFVTDFSGEIGYLFISSHRHASTDVNEKSSWSRPLAAVAVYNPVDIQGANVGAQPVYTRIKKGATATLNAAGATGSSSVTLTEASNAFRDGSADTAIFLKADVLLVTFLSDGSQQAYLISTIVDDTEATLRTLGGGTPTFDDDVLVTVQWFQLVGTFGGNPSTNTTIPTFSHIAPHALSSSTHISENLPRFITREPGDTALSIGSHELDGTPGTGIVLKGGGGIIGTAGQIEHAFKARSATISTASTTVSVTVDPGSLTQDVATGEGYEAIQLRLNHSGAQAVQVTSSFDSSDRGTRVTIIAANLNGQAHTIDWAFADAGEFVFSGSDDALPQAANEVFKWEGIVGEDASGNIKVFMTRTDYEV